MSKSIENSVAVANPFPTNGLEDAADVNIKDLFTVPTWLKRQVVRVRHMTRSSLAVACLVQKRFIKALSYFSSLDRKVYTSRSAWPSLNLRARFSSTLRLCLDQRVQMCTNENKKATQ